MNMKLASFTLLMTFLVSNVTSQFQFRLEPYPVFNGNVDSFLRDRTTSAIRKNKLDVFPLDKFDEKFSRTVLNTNYTGGVEFSGVKATKGFKEVARVKDVQIEWPDEEFGALKMSFELKDSRLESKAALLFFGTKNNGNFRVDISSAEFDIIVWHNQHNRKVTLYTLALKTLSSEVTWPNFGSKKTGLNVTSILSAYNGGHIVRRVVRRSLVKWAKKVLKVNRKYLQTSKALKKTFIDDAKTIRRDSGDKRGQEGGEADDMTDMGDWVDEEDKVVA